MNQQKIGEFIASLRKEQGMTQQQLAELLHVSSKTISKWECGNGMPELSSILPLCEALHININELISGEHLQAEHYSEKAEENMMTLIQQTELGKTDKKNSLITLLVTSVALLLGVWYLIILNMGMEPLNTFYDAPTLLTMLFVTVLFLLGTGLGRPFLSAFSMAVGKKKDATAEDLLRAKSAVKLAGNTFLSVGVLATIIGLAAIQLPYEGDTALFVWGLNTSIFLASLSTIYGLIGYLLLLPILAKLDTM